MQCQHVIMYCLHVSLGWHVPHDENALQPCIECAPVCLAVAVSERCTGLVQSDICLGYAAMLPVIPVWKGHAAHRCLTLQGVTARGSATLCKCFVAVETGGIPP